VPPYEFYAEDGKTVIGYEPELITEAAKRIGATVEFTVLDFDALLPGLDSKRFDVAISGFSDRPARQAKYDMLDVVNDKFAFVGKAEVASTINTLDDICGRSTGAVPGGAYVTIFEKQDEKCRAEGKPGVTIQTYDADAQGFLAVKSGQTDFWPTSLPILADWIEKNPGHAITRATFLEGPGAMILRKNDPLVPKLRDAMQSMVDDGTYGAIMKKWKVESIAVDQIQLNAGKDD
jgi:polar amino acid transport system substrate-binding protein